MDVLLALNSHLHMGDNLSELFWDETVVAVHDDPVAEEMVIAAAHRLADRHGIHLMRVDIEDGSPSMLLSFGRDERKARTRLQRWVEGESAVAR